MYFLFSFFLSFFACKFIYEANTYIELIGVKMAAYGSVAVQRLGDMNSQKCRNVIVRFLRGNLCPTYKKVFNRQYK